MVPGDRPPTGQYLSGGITEPGAHADPVDQEVQTVSPLVLRLASFVSPCSLGMLVVSLLASPAQASADADPSSAASTYDAPAHAEPQGQPVQAQPPPIPAPPPGPTIASPPAPPITGPSGGLAFRVMAGAGFSDYEDRSSGDVHMFANGLAAVSAGFAPVRKAQGTLDVSLELLISRTVQGSPGAHAAGDLLAGGLTLSTFLMASRAEIGLGGYMVRRAPEAHDLALASGRWTAGLGAFLAKYWPITEYWSWGAGVKVLMLPTRTSVEADGEKHVHFSDGVGILGLSVICR
jgi:hypothetical protein